MIRSETREVDAKCGMIMITSITSEDVHERWRGRRVGMEILERRDASFDADSEFMNAR